MAIPVYVQSVTTYPGRTEWSNTADYVVGDRVYYADSISDYSVYVCIQDQDLSGGGTAQQPDLTPNYWQAAGSREYPFLTGSDGDIYNRNFTGTEFCVRSQNSFVNAWDPARYLSISDGSERAHVILMDGIFIPSGGGQAYMNLSNTDFFAENFQKSLFVFTYYDDSNANTTENCPTFNNLKIGLHNAGVSFDSHIILNNCLVSDSSPYSTRTSLKNIHRFQHGKFTQATGCLFDFSMCSNNNFMQSPTVSTTHGRSFLKNTTVIFGQQEAQYGGLFYQANNLIVDQCIFLIKVTDMRTWQPGSSENILQGHSQARVGMSGPDMSNSCVFSPNIIKTDGSSPYITNDIIQTADTWVAGNSSIDDSNLINVDPQFIDLENRDYRLRPSSPLIGGLSNQDKRSEIESQYPQGKWFDSNAAAGGDGSWETPYNNYGEAINSFTGDEAVVLIKEGQHPLLQGFWNGSSWDKSNDLPKAYLGGVKLIGMGKKSIFTAGNEVSSFPAFFNSSYSGATNPNLIDTPFLLKDFTILLTSSSPYNRSLWSLRKGVMINIHVRPEGPGLGNSESNLFDYNMYSSTGDYLHMTSCTIEVTFQGIYGNFCSSGGQKQFSSCTFIDPNHTRSDPYYTKNFTHNSAGNVSGSFIKDCIFYTKSSGFNNTGASTTLCQLLNTVFYSTQDELTLSSGINKTNCAVVDPGFINDNGYEQMDLRLRADSPLIGGVSENKYSADTIWVQPGSGAGTGTEDDAFYWSQYSDAFLAAVQSASKQVVFKDGTYVWNNSIMQDDNVGNNITMVAENIHQAIFTDNNSRVASAGKNPTLRFKGIQLVGNDHFTRLGECHYIFDSVHLICKKYVGALSVTASGTIFEVATGANSYIFAESSSGPVDISNCIFVDHNDRASAQNYLTGAQSGTIKSTIFYTKNPRTYCINPAHNAVLVNCASENITSPENGVLFTENLQFVDVENKNYDLRPRSPLIGQG